jgi:hypothetical protein
MMKYSHCLQLICGSKNISNFDKSNSTDQLLIAFLKTVEPLLEVRVVFMKKLRLLYYSRRAWMSQKEGYDGGDTKSKEEGEYKEKSV